MPSGDLAVEEPLAPLAAQSMEKVQPLVSILIPAHNTEQWSLYEENQMARSHTIRRAAVSPSRPAPSTG
jgi:hypothetical protein